MSAFWIFSLALYPHGTDIFQLQSIMKHTALTGALPTTIGNWANVEKVDMSENNFSDNSGLPTTIGQWVKCEKLVFHQSGIGGAIPTEVGSMTKLETLDLSMNKKVDGGDGISGGIPSELGMLEGSLKSLVLYENSMTGELLCVCVRFCRRMLLCTWNSSDLAASLLI